MISVAYISGFKMDSCFFIYHNGLVRLSGMIVRDEAGGRQKGKIVAKIDKQTRLIMSGLCRALEIIKKENDDEKGVKALEEEIRFRNIVPIPLEISRDKIRECENIMGSRIMNNMFTVVLRILRERYQFGPVRLQRFADSFQKYCKDFLDEDPMGARYVKISDYAIYFRDEFGIDYSDEQINSMIEVEKQVEEHRQRRIQFDVIERMLKNSYPEALEHLKKCLEV